MFITTHETREDARSSDVGLSSLHEATLPDRGLEGRRGSLGGRNMAGFYDGAYGNPRLQFPLRTIDYDNSDRASFGSAVSNPRLFHGTVLHAPCEEHICCDRRGIVVCRCSRGSSNSAKPDTRAGCGSTLDDHTACNAARCEPDDGSSRIHDPHAGSSARSCSRTTPGDRTNPAGTTPRYGRTNLRDPSSRPRTTHR